MLQQAVILCGGLGTRLGKLTAFEPKPLLSIANRPFLDHLIQEVARYGVTKITLIAGHLGNLIADTYAGRNIWGANIEVLVEAEPMGTAGALRFALDHLNSSFFLMNGDSWIDVDLVTVARAWESARALVPNTAAQLLLQHVPDARRFGSVTLRDETATPVQIAGFQEKSYASVEMSGLINAGVYVLDRAIVEMMPSMGAVSLECDILPLLVSEGRVAGFVAPHDSYFIDIGVPDSLEAAQAELLSYRTRPALFLDRDGTLTVDRGYTHRVEDLEWQPGAREAIAMANQMGWFVFVVTNQAGIAHGHYDTAAVEAFHAAMQDDLYAVGAHVDAFEWCPFHPEGRVVEWCRDSRRRKPQPGMIEDLLTDWPVESGRSLLLGDRDSDLQAALAAGVRGVLYSSGSLADLLRSETKEY